MAVGKTPRPLLYLAIALAMGAIFLADVALPLGTTIWVLYLAPIVMTFMTRRPNLPIWVGGTSVLFVIADYFLSAGVGSWIVWLNRASGVVAIATTSLFGRHLIRTSVALQVQTWLKSGQAELANCVHGDLRLADLGDQILRFLAGYLQAHAGAFYFTEADGTLRRYATFGSQPEDEGREIPSGEGLNHLQYDPAEHRVITPAKVNGATNAVIELRFPHPVGDEILEFLTVASHQIGSLIQTWDFRRVEQLLLETQCQAEELQAQEKELRAINEELEQQSESLLETQRTLEFQQTELVQVNAELDRQRKELELAHETLLQKAAELERTSRFKSEFLANMSHELRTPLNSMLILSKILADNQMGNLNDEQVRFAHIIHNAGNELLTVINDILDLSKIEAGKVDVQPEHASLEQVLEEQRQIFLPIADQKRLAFTIIQEPEAPAMIETDLQHLRQILRNLLSNAFKFTEQGGVMLQVASIDSERLVFSVQDSGIGIARPHQTLIFEAFQQADGATNRRFGGTGLGLSISRKLARLIGGHIQVESELGQGATFRLTLPCRMPVAGMEGPPETKAQELSKAVHCILLVDGDPTQREALCLLLADKSIQVTGVGTAGDAMAQLRTTSFDGMILELRLPDMRGDALLKIMAEDETILSPPVIVHTEHLPTPDEEQQLRRFANAIIIKSAQSSARLFDEVALLLHHVKPDAPADRSGFPRQALQRDRSFEGRRILLTEDDVRNVFALSQVLEAQGAHVLIARNGKEAIETLSATRVDLVLMDIMMPEMDGMDAMRAIRAQSEWKAVPIIALTAKAMPDDHAKCLQAGANDHIAKPIDVDKLISLVRMWMPK